MRQREETLRETETLEQRPDGGIQTIAADLVARKARLLQQEDAAAEHREVRRADGSGGPGADNDRVRIAHVQTNVSAMASATSLPDRVSTQRLSPRGLR